MKIFVELSPKDLAVLGVYLCLVQIITLPLAVLLVLAMLVGILVAQSSL